MADPIQPQFRAQMNQVARQLDEAFNPPAPHARTVGFALLTFEFGKTEGGRVNFISNADRNDMIAAVKEWLARVEGRVAETPETRQ